VERGMEVSVNVTTTEYLCEEKTGEM